jgi:hypothetical protein
VKITAPQSTFAPVRHKVIQLQEDITFSHRWGLLADGFEEKIYTREKKKGHILERISIGMQKGRRKKNRGK